MPRDRLTIAQRQRLFEDAERNKTPAQRETERRIREDLRRRYPMPSDKESPDAPA